MEKCATDYRFHTLFHQDFYEIVIMPKEIKVSKQQWVDWEYMAKFDDPNFNQIIDVYSRTHIKRMMGFEYQ